jgi:hypothetical protein
MEESSLGVLGRAEKRALLWPSADEHGGFNVWREVASSM